MQIWANDKLECSWCHEIITKDDIATGDVCHYGKRSSEVVHKHCDKEAEECILGLKNKVENGILYLGSFILSFLIIGFIVYAVHYVYIHVDDMGRFFRICYLGFSVLFIWQTFEFIKSVCGDVIVEMSMLIGMISFVLILFFLGLFYLGGISVYTILNINIILLGLVDILYLVFLGMSIAACVDSIKDVKSDRELDSIRRELNGISVFNLVILCSIRKQKLKNIKNLNEEVSRKY